MTAATRYLVVRRAHFALQLVAALTLSSAAAQAVQAKPGDLDVSFGSNGHVSYVFSQEELALPEGPVARNAGIVQQSDGQLVVGLALGQIIADGAYVLFDSQKQDLAVLRFNSDGSPDLSFNSVGRTGPDFPGVAATTNSVLQQADGKIVAAGEGIVLGPAANVGRIALARYNPDGSPDTSFAAGGAGVFDTGWQITRLPYASDPVHVLQQADGRLVLGATALNVASSNPPWPGKMALARFTNDGALDTTFGTRGSVVLDSAGAGSDDTISGIGQQPDGKLIAAGTTGTSTGREFLLVRLTQEGVLDPSFAIDGRAIVSFDAGTKVASSGEAVIQPDGKILLVGTVGDATLAQGVCAADADAALIRLNPDGSLDATFGDGGKVRFSVNTCDSGESLALAPDGRIFVGGIAGTLSDSTGWLLDPYVARLTPSGRLDATYGAGGISIVDLSTLLSAPYATTARLIRQADGRIVIVADTDGVQQEITRLLETGSYPGVLGLTTTLQNVSASAASISIPVRRTGGSSGAVSVGYATLASSSGATSDGFVGIGGTLFWADADTADKNIVIPMPASMASKGPESFMLTLTNPSGGASLATSEMEVQVLPGPTSVPPPAPGSAGGNTSTVGGGGALGCEVLLLLAITVVSLRRRRG